MKRYKKEENGVLEVGQTLYTKRYALTLDRSLCKGCELCRLVCPRGAVTLTPVPDGADGGAAPSRVDIDENKCDFHGICAVVCPFSAIKILKNGREDLPAVSGGVFPTLIRDIEINSEKCEPGCKRCEEACPLGIVSVRPGAPEESLRGQAGPPAVEIQKELCAGCQICWAECPADAVKVNKFMEGSIRIHPQKCPGGCRRCADVCPVDALEMDGDGKVRARDMHCVYCGACLQVCPEDGALQIERTAVRHTPVNSGAWHKGLEKITSPAGLIRELASERARKARDIVKSLNSDGVND